MPKSIEEFVRGTIEQIENGLPEKYQISDEIKFEISVITNNSEKGGLNIKLASGEINHSKQFVHKIEFGVTNSEKDDESRVKQIDSILSFISKGLTITSGPVPK